MKPNVVGLMMDFEAGKLTDEGVLNLFSELVRSGLVWQLQGSYGRTAADLINGGVLDTRGNILRHADEIED